MPTAELVLSRFPRHLDVDQPGKIVGDVVGSLATPLDAQISQIGKLRRAHRSREVEQRIDLLRLGALHGFDDRALVPVLRRLDALAAVDVDDDAKPALDLLGRGDEVLEPAPGEADDGPARARLKAAIAAAGAYDAWLGVARPVLLAAISDQRDHAATVGGLLDATATYLGLRVDELHHDPEGYWHLARCHDLIALDDRAGEQLIALEENPPYPADLGPTPRRHGDLFHVLRKGFDTVDCTVIVKGIDDRTVAPMVVNIDEGVGVAATFSVPAGASLRFERDGRVQLDGASVATRCYRFTGAVFAADGAHVKDFVFGDAGDPEPPDPQHASRFGDRLGRYAVTHPLDDAFDAAPSFPHDEGLLDPLHLDRTETRFAVFVGAGTFAGSTAGGDVVLTSPQPLAGLFDASVYQPDPAGTRSFEIGFEWDEREAFAVRVWLPAAFAGLDVANSSTLREVVRLLLDRHRAAGVHVYVEHADPRWVLGTGVLRDLGSEDALGVVVAGTGAWADDSSQPTPGPGGPNP